METAFATLWQKRTIYR